MQRVKDYAGFGMWFLGLSYIALLALNGSLGGSPQPLADRPTLHLVGLLAGIAVFVRLLLIALRSTKTPPDAPPKPMRRLRRPEPTVKRIKSRDHFGLRGL